MVYTPSKPQKYPVIGGIGLSIHNIRATGSYIRNQWNFRIVPCYGYLTTPPAMYNQVENAGSFAIYVEPWHADIFDFQS